MGKCLDFILLIFVFGGASAMDNAAVFPCDTMALASEGFSEQLSREYSAAGCASFHQLRLPLSSRIEWLADGRVRVGVPIDNLKENLCPQFICLVTNGAFCARCCDCGGFGPVFCSKAALLDHLKLHECYASSLLSQGRRTPSSAAVVVMDFVSTGSIEQFLKSERGDKVKFLDSSEMHRSPR